ncbi:methionine--tRNA ligase [Candidatus Campbellbacteria bacterium]|nr:MAG: methionine--tRNA ligase [Candidatus Campbellbacteria bacterium]
MTNKNKTFYITTTLPYVNGKPHIGFADEIIRADVLARHKRKLLGGENVFFNTGTDEHGQKIYQKAIDLEISTQEYTDKMSENFKNLCEILNITNNAFTRTTDKDHKKVAQKFWTLCDQKGFIEKRNYKVKYCVGCEMEKTDSELVNGSCPEHNPEQLIEINEENYFFKASNFTKELLELYQKGLIMPQKRANEIKTLLEKEGMKDFSISRVKEKMEWGVEVPNDKDQVMYVWFDALVNYISCLGWGKENESNFEKFWQNENAEVFQIAGKDNLRPQAAMWQSMLLAAGIKSTDKIFINGHITSDGQKMSKSLGNVIDPLEVVDKYGTDALRYFVVRHINNFEDSDWTKERFKKAYNAELAGGIGNLTNRILTMSKNAEVKLEKEEMEKMKFDVSKSFLEEYNFNKEADEIWKLIGQMDEIISKEKPFALIKENPQKAKMILLSLLKSLYAVADWVEPILPETSEKMKKAILENDKPKEPLFGRVD